MARQSLASTAPTSAGPSSQSEPQQEPLPDVEELEAYQTLLNLARRKTGRIPEDIVVRHVLLVTRGGDWPVQRAALEALLRRLASAQQEGLLAAARPLRGRVLGRYQTRRKGRRGEPRPYTTLLLSVSPPAGSCDCPDFIKSSLGLCKHLLALLLAIFPKPRKLAAALKEQQHGTPREGLRFDPIRPLVGRGDWLMQVLWERPPGGAPGETAPAHTTLRRARRWFQDDTAAPWHLKDAHEGDPARRQSLVGDLLLWLDEQGSGGPGEDPALRALLLAEQERLNRVLQDAHLLTGLSRSLGTLKRPLYPYQIEGLTRFLAEGRLLLADDMGLGKTAQAIAACHVLFAQGRVRRGLLVVPASLKPQWLREWQETSDTPVTMVEGNRAEREAVYHKYREAGEGFLIVNYEQVMRDLPLIQELGAQLVVLDEAQRIKNWATKTAACVKTLNAPYRLVLTGTPMENRLEELASLLDWVAPMAIEPKWRLLPWHAQTAVPSAAGARHLDTLRQRLAPCMLRRVRSEVLLQLPPRTDTRVPVEMTPQQRDEHDALNQPIATLVSIMERRPLTPAEHIRLMSLLTVQRIISNGMAQLRFSEIWPTLREAESPSAALREGLFAPKLEALREIVLHLCVDQGRKVVIFSQWRRMLRLSEWVVRDIMRDAGIRAVFFSGAETSRKRTQNIVEFHDDPATRIMFLTDAGGVGLNLQRAASACVNLELPWNPAVLEQRIGRIYRMGQKLPIDVYNLITEVGIEARIAFLVGHKKALFSGLFDGISDEIRYDAAGSFLARMKQLLPTLVSLSAGSGGADGSGALAPEAGAEDAAEDTAPVVRELDELLVLGDETEDGAEEPPPQGPSSETQQADAGGTAEHVAPPLGAEPSQKGEPPAGEPEPVASAQPATPTEAAGPGAATATLSLDAAAVGRLFAEVSIRQTERGGIAIEASPAAAGTLAALFAGMAGLLQGAAQQPR